MLTKMLAIVANAFIGELDSKGEPYFLHCVKVMRLLGENADEDLRCIALGHDLFEDTSITAAFLRKEGFSERVIVGISLLTKHRGQSYEEYVVAVKSSLDTILVKLADLTHNSDIRRIKGIPGQKDFDRIVKYRTLYHELQTALADFSANTGEIFTREQVEIALGHMQQYNGRSIEECIEKGLEL